MESDAHVKRIAAAVVAFEEANRRWVVFKHPMYHYGREQWCVEDRPSVADFLGQDGTTPIDSIAIRSFDTKEQAMEFKSWRCVEAAVDAADKHKEQKDEQEQGREGAPG